MLDFLESGHQNVASAFRWGTHEFSCPGCVTLMLVGQGQVYNTATTMGTV